VVADAVGAAAGDEVAVDDVEAGLGDVGEVDATADGDDVGVALGVGVVAAGLVVVVGSDVVAVGSDVVVSALVSELLTEAVVEVTGATTGFGDELGAAVAFGSRVDTLAFNWFTWSIRFCLRVLSLTLCTLVLSAASLSWA